jgi:quinoprotein relay system zinc metallohydrolase 2
LFATFSNCGCRAIAPGEASAVMAAAIAATIQMDITPVRVDFVQNGFCMDVWRSGWRNLEMEFGNIMKRNRNGISDMGRTLGFLSILLVSLSLFGGADGFAAGRAGSLTIEEISPGNYVHYGVHDDRSPDNLGDNANIGFIVGDRCVMVIDTGGSLPVGQALLKAVREVTDKPVCHVVLSHVHPDHIFGAAAFLDVSPEAQSGINIDVIGHENLPRQLAARGAFYQKALARDLGDIAAGSDIVMPTRTIAAGQVLTVDLGNREVEIKAWPPAHTDHDLSVFDRSTSTLWLADLLFVDHTPVLDSNITGFLDVMKLLRAAEVNHYVPGHGRSDSPWPAVMDPQQAYFELILVETRQAIRDNVRLMDAVNQVAASEAPNWVNFETYHRRNVTTAYTELEWEQ